MCPFIKVRNEEWEINEYKRRESIDDFLNLRDDMEAQQGR